MTRIFLPPEDLTSDEIVIAGDNARHLALVLRIRPEESVIIFDGQGYKYECTVQKVHKKEVVAKVNRKSSYSAESPLSIILAQGIARGEKMDFIIQKSTELGVQMIIPLYSVRSQVHHTHKVERWRKIAQSASQQCGRNKVPAIKEPVNVMQLLNQRDPPSSMLTGNRGTSFEGEDAGSSPQAKKDAGGFLPLVFFESNRKKKLKSILRNSMHAKNITLLIGPEGGFTEKEITTSLERGFIEASLGPRILRSETAAIAALSIIQYELGDIA